MTQKEAKLIKPHKPLRTEIKGWRPSTQNLPEGIRPKDLERMEAKIRTILDNSHIPQGKEAALLNHVRVLCLRVKAFKERSLGLNRLNEELAASQKALRRLDLKENIDIVPLNLWVTREVVLEKGGIEKLLRQVERKIGAK
jgi:hypothetical protein